PYVKEALHGLRESISPVPSKLKSLRRESLPLIRRNEVGRDQLGDIERSALKEIDYELYETIVPLFTADNFYDEITDVTVSYDEVDVYDVTIPSNHLFIADGFVSHNIKADE